MARFKMLNEAVVVKSSGINVNKASGRFTTKLPVCADLLEFAKQRIGFFLGSEGRVASIEVTLASQLSLEPNEPDAQVPDRREL